MVPLWATILVGLAGTVLGTLLNIGHERGREMRTRMVGAADDCLQALFELATGVRDLKLAIDAGARPDEDEIGAVTSRLQQTADQLNPIKGRVQLLFGDSPTLAAIVEVGWATERIREAYTAWLDNEPGARDRAIKSEDAVAAAIARFTVAARRDLRYGGLLARLIDRTVPPPCPHAPRKGLSSSHV
jgi:hypothetical protein